MLNLQLSGIKKIEAIAQSSPEYISLSQGALKLGGIPQKIKNHLQNILTTDKTDYYQSAWGIMELRKKISSTLSNKYKKHIPVNQIIVSHGCIGALATFLFTVLDKDDEIIIPEPTYPAYEKLAHLVRAKPVFVSCKTLRDAKNFSLSQNINDNQWELNLEKIKQAKTTKTKVIIFSNPWNPLGLIVPEKTILELKNWCEKNKIYLVIDEAYKDYAFNKNYKSYATLVRDSEYLITTASFSKNMAMSGWRVGYMITPAKLCKNLGTTQDALLNCPNVPAQYAAIYALDHPQLTQSFANTIKNNLDLCEKYLQSLVKQKIISYQKPKGGFFLFLKMNLHQIKKQINFKNFGMSTNFNDAEDLCMDILSKAKVALIPGKFFGKSGAAYLRLCYARDPEILQEGLRRLVKYFL
ncbi:aminotransferase class I/II-fold pyridoxal phosphate-dependent enzyme [Candidatus Dependentiae bacterium]|nr:aminotransferase class I/II-fold pyridoxal phosphate-dependent enzyme [Candidatus Dependentiae bacterium]